MEDLNLRTIKNLPENLNYTDKNGFNITHIFVYINKQISDFYL